MYNVTVISQSGNIWSKMLYYCSLILQIVTRYCLFAKQFRALNFFSFFILPKLVRLALLWRGQCTYGFIGLSNTGQATSVLAFDGGVPYNINLFMKKYNWKINNTGS